jgi:hypothetical protein
MSADLVFEALDCDPQTLEDVVKHQVDEGVRLRDAFSTVIRMIADGRIQVYSDSGLLALPLPDDVKAELGVTLDFTRVKRLGSEYLRMVADGDSVDSRYKVREEIFEAAIEAVYGSKIWDVLNRAER